MTLGSSLMACWPAGKRSHREIPGEGKKESGGPPSGQSGRPGASSRRRSAQSVPESWLDGRAARPADKLLQLSAL